ncbi:hypothetical protein QN277_025478 [Acacia crassicarpa]|uniref:Uncharacterized protein n=1 Tax=Acacia crassicarpa TaxID=499986 RepID=A0AAE1K542_9FABA|nr:hypothetical protein QN277_025478 [Acacia crassicarpa]
MDHFLYWNAKGAGGSGLFRNVKLLCQGSKPSVIVISETKTDDISKFKAFSRLGYDSFRMIPSTGRSGGLVVAWISSRILVTVMEEDPQFFHLKC